MPHPTIDQTIGNTPLVRLQRLSGPDNARRGNVILGKLEGNNPGGSVKDRPACSMITRAEERGEIRAGDRLIEATSGNTGIALAMIAAMKGYRMTLIMPDNLSAERRASMAAYGAELILTPASKGRHGVRARSRDADAGRGQGQGARSVRQSGQSARALRDDRTRDLARHLRAHHALRQRDGHDRHDHGRGPLPEGTQCGDPDHRRAAGRGLADSRHTQVAGRVPAAASTTRPGSIDSSS